MGVGGADPLLRARGPARRNTRMPNRLVNHSSSRAPQSRGSSSRAPQSRQWSGIQVLSADHFERDIHVAARGMRIGADLFVRFLGEPGEIGLPDALVLDAHLHGETAPATVARADRDG